MFGSQTHVTDRYTRGFGNTVVRPIHNQNPHSPDHYQTPRPPIHSLVLFVLSSYALHLYVEISVQLNKLPDMAIKRIKTAYEDVDVDVDVDERTAIPRPFPPPIPPHPPLPPPPHTHNQHADG